MKDNPFDKEDMYNLRQQFEAHLFKANDDVIKKGEYNIWMSKLREVKEEEELVLLRKAIDITCDAQTELLKAIKPGMKEYQSEAIVEFVFKLNGAEYPGFPSIQGSGANSCVLHYQTNRKQMVGHNLLVSDVGAEYHGYTADVTRTMPVDGKFSEEEAIIYNLVLKAQNAGIKAARVGENFWSSNVAATTVLSQGLQELGIIKTPLELKRYFMHGTSHYLGLDVHDTGTYGKLQANSVITVEPGIYIEEGSPCDPKWWNIGVRIEDDILITKEGPVNLSDCIPRTIPEIEQLMEKNSFINQ
jgi:Xaa-Pro aminopeptidase